MNARWIGRLLRNVHAGERHSALNHPAIADAPEILTLKSEWFRNGEMMPLRSAGVGVGENMSPPLAWCGAPEETHELAIIVEDLDVPLPRPFIHLIAYGISRDLTSLPQEAFAQEWSNIRLGRGTSGVQGYMGPRPIPGHGPHRYIFHMLALNKQANFRSAPRLRTFLEGISGTVIGKGQLFGFFERR